MLPGQRNGAAGLMNGSGTVKTTTTGDAMLYVRCIAFGYADFFGGSASGVSAMTITTYKWGLERYHQAVDAGVFDDQPVELLKGELVVVSPEGLPHTYYSDRFSKILQKRLGNRAQVRESRPITLPNNSEPEPDIAIVQPLDQVYLEHHPYPDNIFWIIEYSNTTLAKDLGIKKTIYAEANIQEYWVVNLKDSQLVVFRNPTPVGFQTALTFAEGMLSPEAFPDLQIEVQQLFR